MTFTRSALFAALLATAAFGCRRNTSNQQEGSGQPKPTSGEMGTSESGTSDTTGAQGTSGTSGAQGTSGTSGTTGAQGTTGTSGTTGAQGTTGTEGTSGAQGTTGSEGAQGTSGTTKPSGESGTQGRSAPTRTRGTTTPGTTGTMGGDAGTPESDMNSGTSNDTNANRDSQDQPIGGGDTYDRNR